MSFSLKKSPKWIPSKDCAALVFSINIFSYIYLFFNRKNDVCLGN